MLRMLLEADQKKCHEMLRRCLDRNLFHDSEFLALSSKFRDVLKEAIIFERLAPGMKEVFLRIFKILSSSVSTNSTAHPIPAIIFSSSC